MCLYTKRARFIFCNFCFSGGAPAPLGMQAGDQSLPLLLWGPQRFSHTSHQHGHFCVLRELVLLSLLCRYCRGPCAPKVTFPHSQSSKSLEELTAPGSLQTSPPQTLLMSHRKEVRAFIPSVSYVSPGCRQHSRPCLRDLLKTTLHLRLASTLSKTLLSLQLHVCPQDSRNMLLEEPFCQL